ncbi:MAG: thiamine ABC transporter substrate-binding protein [Caldilineaceae bacterium]|nr:thiamine ABC transporter substrate-binding protein [Caldilineaceae bacterium]
MRQSILQSIQRSFALLLLSILLLLVACQPVAPATAPTTDMPTEPSAASAATLVLASHDSFNISEEVLAQFEAEHNVKLQLLELGDAGEALNKIILSKDAPLADLFFGVDNTFLSRALAADVFVPYASPALAAIPDELQLDPEHRLLPVDVGYVNINADATYFAEHDLPLPQTLEDLTQPAYQGLFVALNPATSSPGLAFLLATIDHFGEENYLAFWEALRANDVLITNGWSEAYYDHFTVGSGGTGDRPLVVSYTTSPPADVLYASDGRTEPASVNLNLAGGVFRQIEFVGILQGTQQAELAQQFVDFMLSETFQADVPLQMFVYPALPEASLPELFVQFAEQPAVTPTLDAATIDANREQWIDAWTNVMLR